MVYNGILMETIGISVMVSIGLLLFFYSRYYRSTNMSFSSDRWPIYDADFLGRYVWPIFFFPPSSHKQSRVMFIAGHRMVVVVVVA